MEKMQTAMKSVSLHVSRLNEKITVCQPNISPVALKRWSVLIEEKGLFAFDLDTAILSVQDWTCTIGRSYSTTVTMETILQGRTPSLIGMAVYDNPQSVIDILEAHITAACSFFNVAGNMSNSQIEETAYLLFDAYRHLRIDDVVLCLKWAKAGRYGKVYDRMDGNIILSWFAAYFAERQDAIEAARINAHQRRKDAERKNNDWTPEGIAAFKKILDALTVSQEAHKVETQKKKEEAAMAEKQAFEANRQEQQKTVCTDSEIEEIKNRPISYE